MWDQVRQALNHSMLRMLDQVASMVPGLVALVVAMVFSAVLAGIVAFLLRRSLMGLQFDDRLLRWGFPSLAEWSPSKSPTLLVTRVVFWGIVLVGFLVGIAAFDSTLTSQLVFQLFAYLPNVVAALLVLLAGSVIARFLARSVLI